MFSHILAGEVVFLWFGYLFGIDITSKFLIFGAFCGFLPDLLSFGLNKKIKYNKWYHTHRDNFSHSVFFPLFIFAVTFFFLDIRLAIMISAATLTHPFFDLWGIGYGIKPFLPFSDKAYKFFYRGKLIYTFKDDKERMGHIRKYGENDWFERAYLDFKLTHLIEIWGIFEWLSLFLAIYLIFLVS